MIVIFAYGACFSVALRSESEGHERLNRRVKKSIRQKTAFPGKTSFPAQNTIIVSPKKTRLIIAINAAMEEKNIKILYKDRN